MSFKSKDLMVDVLPAGRRFAAPGLVLCGQATAGGGGGDEGGDELDCGQATAGGGGGSDGVAPLEADLALLRRQLHQTLAVRV